MKKIRNVENPFEFETVVFSFSEEQILRELIAESSYVAKSLVGQSDLKSGWSRSIIFSEDDKPFLSHRNSTCFCRSFVSATPVGAR